MINIKQYYSEKPVCQGRIRAEKWGGLYYHREQLRIDLLNEAAYHILKYSNGKNTINEIEDKLIDDFEVSRKIIRNDLTAFLDYGYNCNYIHIDNWPEKKANAEVLNYNEQKKVIDDSLLKGLKVIGMEPNVLSAPIKVLIEFTHNCNLRCIHCFANADYQPDIKHGYLPGELNTEQWCRVIDNLAAAQVFDIFASGGEAMIRDDIFEIMSHIKSKGMGFCLLTNATLINDEKAKKLKELGCFKVEANLDGPDAASYDKFRGVQGAFEKTVSGIQACLRNGLSVRCNITATTKNIFQLKEIIQTAWKIGVRELCAVPLEPGGRGKEDYDNLNIRMEEFEKIGNLYKEAEEFAQKEYGGEFYFIGAVDLTMCNSREDKIIDLLDPNQIMPLCCSGRLHCSIGPDGNAILCPASGKQIKITPGDCLNEDFRKIWLEADVFKAVRNPNNSTCSNCEYFRGCLAGCSLRSYQKYGEFGIRQDEECYKVYLKKYGKK